MGLDNGDKTEHVRRSNIFKADPGHGMNAHMYVLDVCEFGSSLKCFLLPCCVCVSSVQVQPLTYVLFCLFRCVVVVVVVVVVFASLLLQYFPLPLSLAVVV